MARGNYFKPNAMGYRAVMNSRNDVMDVCELRAGSIAASAARQTGIDYLVDSQVGLNRIHTRVSTVTEQDYYRERHYHSLSIAIGAIGGTPNTSAYGGRRGKRSLDSYHTKKWRGWRPKNRPRW